MRLGGWGGDWSPPAVLAFFSFLVVVYGDVSVVFLRVLPGVLVSESVFVFAFQLSKYLLPTIPTRGSELDCKYWRKRLKIEFEDSRKRY